MLDPAITSIHSHSRAVGITKGPGETTHEYTFVSRDDEQELKNGEYVYYELADPDGVLAEARRVLGRILKRVPLQLYPDTFLAEPEIAPYEVAAIMGYYDPVSASFINPWIPPQSGKQIFLADHEMLTNILSRKHAGESGSATIGSLLTRQPNAVPVVLSVKDVVSTHLAIIASTGAGKSYLASVLIEELMQPYNKACVLIIDPHGEYSTLEELPNFPQFSEASEGKRPAYQATVRVYKPEQVKVRISS